MIYWAISFTTLWIYTILKRAYQRPPNRGSFTTLWIYTILKLYSLVNLQR